MRLSYIGSKIGVIAENDRDLQVLVDLVKGKEIVSKVVRKHKKHNHVKVCEFCGKGFKGLIGVGIHKVKCPKRIINK